MTYTPRESLTACLIWFGIPALFWGGVIWLVNAGLERMLR